MAGYVGVVHRRQAAHAAASGFVAFSHGREAAVRGLRPGDGVIYYAPKDDFDGAPVQAFVALATVTGAAPEERDYPGGRRAWTRAATFHQVREVPVRPLLDRLSFVKGGRNWGLTFRLGKFAIPDADFDLIAGEMRA